MSEEIDNGPKTPLEAAIDRATGYEPGDENRVVTDAEQDGQGSGAEAAEVGIADETKPEAAETKPVEVKGNAAPVKEKRDWVKENAAPVKEKRDWVKEAYEFFIKNAVDSDPTDPVKAIAAYFEKNATDELKAKAKAEGKTGASCWKFIKAVARKALGGRSGHIDPVAIYAIAMHYFQDVPKDWEKVEKVKAESKVKSKGDKVDKPSAALPSGVKKTKKIEELERKISQPGSAKRAQELKAKLKAEKERIKEKERKAKGEQGFFFDLMETETVSTFAEATEDEGLDGGNGGVSAAEQDGKEADGGNGGVAAAEQDGKEADGENGGVAAAEQDGKEADDAD